MSSVWFSCAVIPFVLTVRLSAAALISTGQTLLLDDIPYYLPPLPYTKVSFLPPLVSVASTAGLVPVTVVAASATNSSQGTLQSIIDGFGSDDVWSQGFLEAVLIQYRRGSGQPFPANASFTLPGSNRSSLISVLLSNNASTDIPSGPYLATSDGSLYQVYRLYSDFASSFTQPLIANGDGTYSPLPANIAGIQSPAVGVPSRLYYTKTAQKPLAGIRLGVKDIFDIAGVKTSNGNRAWYNFYPPATANAVPVQRLIDAGAIIIGKMKTSQFANGETATADWVDYHSPFNPRGDGYQDPSSSSSGPGAGVASYPWLDLGLGSDTGGSIRGPAQVQGLFGNRPTHGLVPLTSVLPLAPQLDTAGFLARDPAIWTAAASVLYNNLTISTTYPTAIHTIDFPTTPDTETSRVLLSFLSTLSSFLSAPSTPLNLSTLWSSPPTAPPNITTPLPTFLNTTYPLLISKFQTALVRDPFFAAYAAAHQGRKPFVNPAPLTRWAYGDSFPASALTEALTDQSIFADWWNSVVQPNCEDNIILYASILGGADYPIYRNVYRPAPSVPFGFSTARVGPLAGVPDFAITVGEASYTSNITGHREVLPVTVDVIAGKGCDGLIFGLVGRLVEEGIVKGVEAGGTINGGDILF